MTNDADVAAIRADIEPWTRCCLERDWDTLLEMCTDDVAFSAPGETQVAGPAVRPWLDAFPTQTAFDWDFDRIEVSGNLAVASGSGTMTVVVDGEEVDSSFDFMNALRKSADGSWRRTSIIFNNK